MTLPRLLFQMLLLPILALMLPLIYAIAWLREAIGDFSVKRAPVIVMSRVPTRIPSRVPRRDR